VHVSIDMSRNIGALNCNALPKERQLLAYQSIRTQALVVVCTSSFAATCKALRTDTLPEAFYMWLGRSSTPVCCDRLATSF
jgi:hypothetical protein